MSFDHLFTPLKLGPIEIRNRIVSTSHQTSLVSGGLPTDELVAYQAARAEGGAGLLSVEASSPDPSGQLSDHQIAAYKPEAVPQLAKIADAVHAHGAKLFIQLCHGGREQVTGGYRAAAVSSSAVPSQRFHAEPRALVRSEIDEIVDGHRISAANAREAGLDGIEALAGYNYLPGQFLSPRVNLRDDEYGGSLEGRMRFLVEVLGAMREGIGSDRALGLRLTAESVGAAGLRADETLEVFAALGKLGLVDYVSTSIGDSSSYRGSLWIAPPAPIGSERLASLAGGVRGAIDVPVIATTRVTDPEVAELMIARGEADAVGMTRAMVADPELANKIREGRIDEIERCTGCNQACIGHYHAGTPINCAINPWTGREATLPKPTVSKRKIVIVGGGPAGCAAVRAAPGADVVLFESSSEGLGGQWRHALRGPSHEQIARLTIENLERWAAPADVRLGVTATLEQILAEDPDLVVLASGASQYLPALEIGPGAPKLVSGWELLDGAPIDGPVVVWEWGGDWTGMIAAEMLAVAGNRVRFVSGSAAFGEGMHQYQRNLYLGRLDELGVELLHHLDPVGLAEGAVLMRNVFSDRETLVEDVGTLVAVGGRSPQCALYAPLVDAGVAVERAGDCLGARTTEEAVHEGTLAALLV
ncbi:MAG: oxidoreductase [Actinobacteria bacterium]|uniref:Unannotated protein n=1 Tax=freshwater metagenome TaxID=449393 RepID=A0A6J5ZYZ5_9ZZZZ|nr:oxidoreductase [Actinomycetota bacterium]